MEKHTLLAFIAKAHRHTYAAPPQIREQHRCKIPILEGHKDFEFVDGDLKYHDSYAGSTWAPGKEVVFFRGKPIWCMAYQGQHDAEYDEAFFQEQAFPFLKKALMRADETMPFRGPLEFSEGDFTYVFEMDGDYQYFRGHEKVLYKGEVVFFQDVMGSEIR
ncbi:MAG: DUF5680 domain-containing protein [Nanoarchaeota archaeon]